jgi:small-conductance mechanosensitive channel
MHRASLERRGSPARLGESRLTIVAGLPPHESRSPRRPGVPRADARNRKRYSECFLARRVLRGAAFIVILLAVAKASSVYALGRIEDTSTRFTLRRVEHLIVAWLFPLIIVSIIFVNWYAALTALGVGSIIVGLAVQTPMKSFIAWIYILLRRPYQVGDRIKMGDATGDVIDVGYLDTTLWKFAGQYLSTDHPSGRVIRFPNEKVLDSIVWNYSWPLFPYIWNEIKF